MHLGCDELFGQDFYTRLPTWIRMWPSLDIYKQEQSSGSGLSW